MNGIIGRCKPVYPPLFQSGDIKVHYSKYGKKIGQIQGRISMRRLLRDPTIQYIIINLVTKYNYIIINLVTKYDYSSLHGFTAIFDEKFHYSKYGKEENWTNTGKNKHQMTSSQSHNKKSSFSTCIPNMTTLACTVL